MFQVQDRAKRTVVTVFGVHKSGPADDQTKFLIHDGRAWRWEWASQFQPIEVVLERPMTSAPRFAAAVA